MTNNPDITIQKLALERPKNQITRSFGIFDPLATATFSATRQKSGSTSAIAGASTLNRLDQPLSMSYTQLLQTGTTYTVNFGNTKSSSNSANNLFNPSFSSNLNFDISQPLIRNRGGYVTRIPILVAKSSLRAAEYTQEDAIMALIVTAETSYWNVISARENVRVQEKSLEVQDLSLKRELKSLELGATSPLDIFRPKQAFAQAEFNLSQARYRLAQAEDNLRRQMGADSDPKFRTMPIVLTETVESASTNGIHDREELVNKALARRPDLKSLRQNLDIDDLNIRSASNLLRPDLSLGLRYGASGTGGTYTQRSNYFAPDGEQSTLINVIPGGFGDALNQLFGFGLPTYRFSLTLRLPIRDRANSAGMADALVAKKQDSLRIRSRELDIRQQVLNAINNVENSRQSVELAKVVVEMARNTADAEQKKYDLGTSVLQFLVQAQADQASAEANLVTQMTQYRINQMLLLRQLGTLLDERGIVVQ
jgi:outer membrane protein TolC